MNKVASDILHILKLKSDHGWSVREFDNVLGVYHKGLSRDADASTVPENYTKALTFLNSEGYQEPKQLFFCINKHHWAQLEEKEAECPKCHAAAEQKKPPSLNLIEFHYLTISNRLKYMALTPAMCYSNLEHWRARHQWIENIPNPTTPSARVEIWQAEESVFRKYSWFWDPEREYYLPAKCGSIGCKHIFMAREICPDVVPHFGATIPERHQPEIKELKCPLCKKKNSITPRSTSGDPRNIALILHYDGWSPKARGGTSKHKSGK